MNRSFQPHESHVPFLLQFKVCSPLLMQPQTRFSALKHWLDKYGPIVLQLYLQIDFNLYGMGLLRLGNVLFRHPVPQGQHIRHGWAETPVLAVSDG